VDNYVLNFIIAKWQIVTIVEVIKFFSKRIENSRAGLQVSSVVSHFVKLWHKKKLDNGTTDHLTRYCCHAGGLSSLDGAHESWWYYLISDYSTHGML
jgi:hypothetical protein